MENLERIRALVGDVTQEQLKYVDCYVSDGFGVFVPSVGFCGYAVTQRHTHPAYSGVIIPSKGAVEGILPLALFPDEHNYVGGLLSPGVPHEEEPGDTFRRYFALLISKERFEAACAVCETDAPVFPEWRQFLISTTIVSLINAFMRECESDNAGKAEASSCWAELITYALIRAGCVQEKNADSDLNPNAQIEAILQHIHQNFQSPMPVGELAGRANMSESSFNRLFKKETGQSPAKYIHGVRLQKARKLLSIKDCTVTEAALACGFSEVSHFSGSFKGAYGMTPSEFKESCL